MSTNNGHPAGGVTVSAQDVTSIAQAADIERGKMDGALAVTGIGQAGFWASIQPSNDAQLATLHRAVSGGAESMADLINQTVAVENVVFHRVTVADETTGEEKNLCRMILVGPDGRCVASCSTGALSSFMSLIQLAGMPPWSPPRWLTIRQLTTRRKRRTFALELAPPPAPPPADGKKK